MKKLLLSMLLICWANSSFADSYTQIPEKFFGYIKQGQAEQAIDFLYGTNKWVGKNADQVINLKTQLAKLNNLVGKYLFHELISETKVGSRYVHLIYLVGYERQPIRFEIKVYNAEHGWRFQGVSFDASVTDDIEKQANAHLVK